MSHRLEFLILCILAFTAGSAASFAMAPYHWWGLLFPALSGLYLLLLKCKGFRGGLAIGWAYGFGFFIFSLSWIGNALLVEGNPYAWAWPLAVSVLPAGLALFPALACGISVRFFPLSRIGGFLAFCALLGLSEWLRGHILTGFPWNLTAYAWGNALPLLQILRHVDVYALSLFITLLSAAPALCVHTPRRPAPYALVILLGLGTLAIYFYGYERLSNAPLTMQEDIIFKVVQPNTPQNEKWDHSKIADHFQTLVTLSAPSDKDSSDQTTVILWPETALHYLFLNDAGSRGYIRSVLESYAGPAFLITGALIRDQEKGSYTNSIITIDKTGEIVNRYDKFHLVPFGEYIPFHDWIPLETITRFKGFERGPGPQTKTLPLSAGKSLKFSPLVCYEILFPGRVIDSNDPPDLIVNTTNDGWYGYSAGPHQHFLKARFRAIEEGIPVVRSANTGISGIIDPYGRALNRSELFTGGVYISPLPARLSFESFTMGAIKLCLFWVLSIIFYAVGLQARQSANSGL